MGCCGGNGNEGVSEESDELKPAVEESMGLRIYRGPEGPGFGGQFDGLWAWGRSQSLQSGTMHASMGRVPVVTVRVLQTLRAR